MNIKLGVVFLFLVLTLFALASCDGTDDAYTWTNSRGESFYLHGKETVLSNGEYQMIYYFAFEVGENAVSKLPDGYEVYASSQDLPVLKKIR